MKIKVSIAPSSKGVHAHVLDLPGCFSRGESESEAIATLEPEVRAYLSDLHRHGEDVGIPDVIDFEVVESNAHGTGPFDPGDTAALFEPEKSPVPAEEIESRFLRRAAYNRRDLLDLIRDIHPKMLDWKPTEDAFTIGRILRHIGNADQWYVSRIVDPDTYPPEWENDDDMPLFEYLEMSRRTSFERIRAFSEEERSGRVLHPTHSASNPTERWTARKALRRMLEHEREHTAHLRETFAQWRVHYLARLAAERSDFLWQFRFLSEKMLTANPVFDDWAVKDLLAHVGEWDKFHTDRLAAVRLENWDEVAVIESGAFYEAHNAQMHAAHGTLTVGQALERAEGARKYFLDWLAAIPDTELHRERALPDGDAITFSQHIKWRYRHDSMHNEEIRAWRKTLSKAERKYVANKQLLLAIMQAAHDEIAALIELIPENERETRPVEGVWTLRDTIGHLTDWEYVGFEWAEKTLRGQSTVAFPEYEDEENWNAEQAAHRKSQPFSQIWQEYLAVHEKLISLVKRASLVDLAKELRAAWGGDETLYQWLLNWPHHQRDHAAVIRTQCRLPGYPERLLNKDE